MFRNFTKPAVLEKSSFHERTAKPEACSKDSKKPGHDGFQPISECRTEKRSGHTAPKDVQILHSKCLGKDHLNSKGVYTTTIYVNGKPSSLNGVTNISTNQTLASQKQTEQNRLDNSKRSQHSLQSNKGNLEQDVLNKRLVDQSDQSKINKLQGKNDQSKLSENENKTSQSKQSEILERSCQVKRFENHEKIGHSKPIENHEKSGQSKHVETHEKGWRQNHLEIHEKSAQPKHLEIHEKSAQPKHLEIHEKNVQPKHLDIHEKSAQPKHLEIHEKSAQCKNSDNHEKCLQPKHSANTGSFSTHTVTTQPHAVTRNGDLKHIIPEPCKKTPKVETEGKPTTKHSTTSTSHIPNNRCSLFSQTKFNVIPLPPPMAEPAFAGLRDLKNPRSIHEKEIVSVKGTVRGFKNRVRAGIATFWAQAEDKRNFRKIEQGKIVVYATSMSVVRETSEHCKIVRRLLQNHMVRYEERDVYMSRELQQELKQRLAQENIAVTNLPQVFADGIHIGGAEELEKLNEAGQLRGLLDNYQKVIVRIMCSKCGGYRFLPCEFCHGSKKSLLRNHFTEEFCALRCMHCDENGLRRCDLCIDQQE